MNDYKTKSKKYSGGMKALLSDWMIAFLFVALFALCCLNSNFRTTNNIMNVLRQASFVAIIAMGEFFVILIGRNGYVYHIHYRYGFDLLRRFCGKQRMPIWLANL